MAEHAKALLPRHAAGGRPVRSAATALAAPAGTPAARSWHPCARCRARARPDARRNRLRTTASAASVPASRQMAPSSASTASASIESRSRPPLDASPAPSRSTSPSASSRPISGQRLAAHQADAQPVQLAFAQRRVTRIELGRDAEVEHRVAEELETFVVAGAEARVRQRQFEQVAAREVVPDTGLQARQVGAGVRRHRE